MTALLINHNQRMILSKFLFQPKRILGEELYARGSFFLTKFAIILLHFWTPLRTPSTHMKYEKNLKQETEVMQLQSFQKLGITNGGCRGLEETAGVEGLLSSNCLWIVGSEDGRKFLLFFSIIRNFNMRTFLSKFSYRHKNPKKTEIAKIAKNYHFSSNLIILFASIKIQQLRERFLVHLNQI